MSAQDRPQPLPSRMLVLDLATAGPRDVPEPVRPIAITAQESSRVMNCLTSYLELKNLVDGMLQRDELTAVVNDMEASRSEIMLGVFIFGILADEHFQKMKVAANSIDDTTVGGFSVNQQSLAEVRDHAAIAERNLLDTKPLGAACSPLPIKAMTEHSFGSQEAMEVMDNVFRNLDQLPPHEISKFRFYLSFLIQSDNISTFEQDTPELIEAKNLVNEATKQLTAYLRDQRAAWHDIQTGRTLARNYDEQLLPTRSWMIGTSLIEHMAFHPDLSPWTAARYIREIRSRFNVQESQQMYRNTYNEQYGYVFGLETEETGEKPYILAQQTDQRGEADNFVNCILESQMPQYDGENYLKREKVFNKVTKNLQAEQKLLELTSTHPGIKSITMSSVSENLLDIIVVGDDDNAVIMHVDRDGRVMGGFPSEFNRHGDQTRGEALFAHILPDVMRGLEDNKFVTKKTDPAASSSAMRRPEAAGQPKAVRETREERLARYATERAAAGAEQATLPIEEESEQLSISGIEQLPEEVQREIRQWVESQEDLLDFITSGVISYTLPGGKTIQFELNGELSKDGIVTSVSFQNLHIF